MVGGFDIFTPSEEHGFLRDSIKSFVDKEVEPQAAEFNAQERFNIDLFHKLGTLGVLGLTVDSEFGGTGLDAVAAVIVHEELSASDPGFCLAYLAHSMLCANNLCKNASKEQKQLWLPKLSSGEWVGAMAMSETQAGTDVLSMQTSLRRDGDHFVIDGSKLWITNGCLDDNGKTADCLLLYVRDTELSKERPKISTIVVEGGTPGFAVGQKINEKLGMRASNTAELTFSNCRVPVANLVGQRGDALKHMMRNLELERLTLAAMGLGIAKRALEVMLNYANQRSTFGKKIVVYGQIQAYIAESYAEYQAARSYIYNVANNLDLTKGGNRLDSDGVKLIAAPLAKRVSDRAIQVLGGNGYVGQYVVERLWRDAKLLEIGGGTLEAHQKNIANDLSKSI